MAIKQGNSDVSAIYVGSTEVTKIYRGTSLVWEGGAPPTPIDYNITNWDNGVLGFSTSNYTGADWYVDTTYTKIN